MDDRKELADMTDREILEETAQYVRVLYDAISALGNNPMAAAFMGSALPGKR